VSELNQEVVSSSPNKQSGFAMVLSVVLLVVIGVLLAGGYYFWKKSQAELELLHTYVAKVESELGVKADAVKEFKSSLAKVAADSQSQDAVLSGHLRTLEEQIASVDTRVNKVENSGSEWLLSEVEYMLNMADLRIGMKEDVKGAVNILKQAEDLIKKLPTEDKGLMAVRVAISRDIATMESYRNIDVPGTYASLVALGDNIEKLPIIPTKLTEPEAVLKGEAAKSDKKDAKPSTMLSEINETFAGYLTIRKHDTEELKALLSPEQRLNFRDSVRLTMDQAQTALLRGDQAVYDASLAKIRKWMLDYFVSDNFKVQMAMKKLEELASVQIKRDLPGVADSQQELKSYISDKMMQEQGY
jgi:uroporphyrin-III C-methyltransferase